MMCPDTRPGAFRRPWLTVSVLYAVLTAAYCWPLILSIGSVLPNDVGDPGLLSWVLWWNAHAVPFTERWWNAPMFVPAQGALAFSDTLLGMAPLTSPLQWLGCSPIVAHNLMFLVAMATAALAGHALAHELTGRHDAALVAGLAFGFSPYRASQLPHLQLLVTAFMPLGILALHRYLASKRTRELGLFGVCWLLNGLISGYYLVFYAVFVGLWMLWFVRDRRAWLPIGVAVGLASLPLIPLLIGHHHYQAMYGMKRGREEIEFFSADLSAFWTANVNAWLPSHWTFETRPEGELYPGAVIVVLTLVGALGALHAAWRARVRASRTALVILGTLSLALAGVVAFAGGWRTELAGVQISLTHPHRLVIAGALLLVVAAVMDRRLLDAWRRRSAFGFYGCAAVVTIVLALGPVGHAFGFRFLPTGPYAWLMLLPGGDSLRVPARFGMLTMLCLGQTAAIVAARIAAVKARPVIMGVLALGVLADGWVPRMPVAATPPMLDLPGTDPRAIVLEVPTRDVWTDAAAMLRATRHGHAVVNGFSGYLPPHYRVLQEGLVNGDDSALDALRQIAPLVVIVNRSEDETGAQAAFISRAPDAQLLYRSTIGPVYKFAAKPAPTRSASEQPLTIARVETNSHALAAGALVDGTPEAWTTATPQQEGTTVTVSLARPSTVSRIEMDLGSSPMDYPRRLQVAVVQPDGTTKTLWAGGTAGYVVTAVLADRIRVPVSIDLPPAIASRLVLTLLTGDADYHWTVAELRVFGPVN